MRLDPYSNPIYSSQDIFNLLYQGKIESLPNLYVDIDQDLQLLEEVSGIKLKGLPSDTVEVDVFDEHQQQQWFMPDQYKSLDIKQHILDLTPPWDPCWTRVNEELEEYEKRNMLDLLRWLKYFVDECTEHNIVKGVGRGSSVASYVLYLLNVHYVDSIKYNLDWRDFLR